MGSHIQNVKRGEDFGTPLLEWSGVGVYVCGGTRPDQTD